MEKRLVNKKIQENMVFKITWNLLFSNHCEAYACSMTFFFKEPQSKSATYTKALRTIWKLKWKSC